MADINDLNVVSSNQSASIDDTPITDTKPTLDYNSISELPDNLISKKDTRLPNATDEIQPGTQRLINFLSNPQVWARDDLKYAKDYGYDADNFERYYNVPRIFTKIGYSPWRDNETEYNKQITFWEDYKRAGGQAASMAGTAYNAMLPWNALDPISADLIQANEMTRANKIGASSFNGVKGFFNNLTLNTGFSMGIGAEFATEQLAMTGLSALTGGGTLSDQIIAGASKVIKIGKFVSSLFHGLEGLNDISKIRDLFSAAKMGEKAVDALKFITPHTGQYIYDVTKNAKAGNLVFDMAKASEGAGSLYRDVHEMAAVLSESKMEGGSTYTDQYNNLVNAIWEKEHRMPTPDEYAKIEESAYHAGLQDFWYNVPGLWVSNKIVLDKMFRGFPSLGQLTEEYATEFGKLSFDEAVAKMGKDAWKGIEEGIRNTTKKIFNPDTYTNPKSVLKSILGKATMYSTESLTEGLEEVYQDAASYAAKKHYTDVYTDPTGIAAHGSFGYFAQSLGQQFTSKQGWETFASGFFMGALVQFPQHIMYEKIPKLFGRLQMSEQEYKDFKADRETRKNELVNALNNITKDPSRYFNQNTENLIEQRISNMGNIQTAQTEDVKNYMDHLDDATFNQVYTVLKSGKMDILKTQLKGMNSLTGEELEQAYGKLDKTLGDPKTYYTKKLDDTFKTMDTIQERYEYMEKKYGQPFNPKKFNKGTEEYNNEYHNWLGFEDAKKLAIFSGYSFDKTLERMNSIFDDLTKNRTIKNSSARDISVLLRTQDMDDEIKSLKNEVKAFEGGDGDDKKIAKKKADKLEKLQQYRKDIAYYQEVLDKTNKDTTQMPLLKEATENLHKSFTSYLNTVAKLSGDKHVFEADTMNAFDKLKDFYHLNRDSFNLSYAINQLTDPGVFTQHAQRMSNVRTQIFNQKHELFKQAVDNYTKSQDMNDLINKVYETGAIFDPEELNAFEKGVHPTTFYDVTQSGKPLSVESAKYKEIENLLAIYEREHGMQFTSKPITGNKYQDLIFDKTSRPKSTGDNRTYEDLAKQFGFDPAADETILKMSDVLDKIINSPQASYREKALAVKLREKVKPEQTIKFRKHGVAGSYSAATGIIIDARYSSSDYQNGTTPIEHVILRNQLHYMMTDALKTDTVFAKAIKDLLDKASKFFQDPANKDKHEPMVYLGLKNELDFVAEAMSNDNFQKYLAQVPYTSTGTSTWKEFLNAIHEFLEKLLGISAKDKNTVLNEALYLITSKIDDARGPVKKTPAATTTQTKTTTKPAATASSTSPAQTPTAPSIKTPEMIRVMMEELHYPRYMVDGMTMTEINEIIKNNTKFESETAAEKEARIKQEAQQLKSKESLEKKLAEVKYFSELHTLMDEMVEIFINPARVKEMGIDSNMVKELFAKREQELATEVNFDDINEDDALYYKLKNKVMIVDTKTNNSLFLVPIDDRDANPIQVVKSKVTSENFFMDRPGAPKVDNNINISEQDKENSDANIKNQEENTESMKERIERIKKENTGQEPPLDPGCDL